MNRPQVPGWSALVLLIALLALPACSKKTQEPPATTPPPAEEPAQAPSTPEEPAPTPSTPEPTAMQWQDVFFDFDSYALTAEGRAALDGNARLMRDNASGRVTIEGHCDERGTTEYNLALGERRAAAARDYLAAAGVDAGRMDIISYGEERPFATGSDESSWAQNRRAHFATR